MLKNNLKLKSLLKSVFIIALFVFSIKATATWFPPTTAPIGGNTPSPIHVGSDSQYKVGGVVLGGLRVFGAGSIALFDGRVEIQGGTPGAGKVLTSDATGLASWQTFSGGGPWTKTGTNIYPTDFNNDNVGIGTDSPDQQLEITKSFMMPISTNSTTGVIYKGASRFLHNYGSTTTSGNTFLGMNSGNFTTTGKFNTGIGENSLDALTTGGGNVPSGNTAVGYNTLTNNTSGGENTAVGINALQANNANTPNGGGNTALGASAMYSNTTGNNNVAIGLSALFTNTSGSDNIAIGRTSNVGSNNLQNATAIGASTTVDASNTMVFGNSLVIGWGFGTQPGSGNAIKVGTTASNGNGARLTSGGVWTAGSDRNKKHSIESLPYGLSDVIKLRPVTFEWNKTNQKDIGFIAQEVKEVIPEIVYGEEGDMSISYSQITTVLTKAIQEQQVQIEELKKEIEILKAK